MAQTIGTNVAKHAYDAYISQQFPGYSAVRIIGGEDSEGNPIVYEAGDTTAGQTLELQNDFGNQQMARNILESIRGYQYQPLSANSALLNPAAEMGDGVSVNDVYSGIFVRATTFGRLMASDIAAPTDEELVHEYGYKTQAERVFSRTTKATRAAITLNSQRITAEVERSTTEDEQLSARITINADRITSEVTRAQDAENSLSSRITQNSDSISAEVTRASREEGDLSARITATASEIESTVAAAGVWDAGSYNVSVNGFGNPDDIDIDPSEYTGQYYLDKITGVLYYSTGHSWQYTAQLVSIQSSLQQTAAGIRAEVQSQGDTKLDKDYVSSSFGWALNATGFELKSNGNQVFLANEDGIKITGDAEFTGKITATSGYIGDESNGFTISTSAFYDGKTSFDDVYHDGVYIGTDGIALGNYQEDYNYKTAFSVTKDGELTAKSGTIGGLSINASSLYSEDKTYFDSYQDGVYIGSDGIALGAYQEGYDYGSAFSVDSEGEVKIRKGSLSIGDSFSVTDDGKLSATGAEISGNVEITGGSISIGDLFEVDIGGNLKAENVELSGEITATSGEIGGFTIGNTSLTFTKAALIDSSDGVYIGTDGISLGGEDEDNNALFSVDSQGNLRATSATISGDISITSGSINIGDGVFRVDSDGNLNATSGTFSGNVWAGQIQSGGAYDSDWNWIDYGTFDGSGLTLGSVYGGVDWYGDPSGALALSAVAYGNTDFTGTLDQVGTNASNIDTLFTEIATVQAGYFASISTSAIAFGNYALYVGSDGIVRGSYI